MVVGGLRLVQRVFLQAFRRVRPIVCESAPTLTEGAQRQEQVEVVEEVAVEAEGLSLQARAHSGA